jgi:formate-dependent nitrite reductase cytochrome c552 subunit
MNTCSRAIPAAARRWALGLAAALLLLYTPAAQAAKPAAAGKNSCVTCHSDPKFLVQNKKLYDYFQNWKLSVHRQENVSCADCHGGNPQAEDKQAAHAGTALGASEASSPISYQNVPATCARCHADVFKSFQQSAHFKNLISNQQEKQAPNCVTCHGSVNISVLNVSTVRTTCARCHNKESGLFPEIPGEAESVLSDFLSIHRYYRYIAAKGEPKQIKALFKIIDPRIKRLNANWHTFDLPKVKADTEELITFLKMQRDQMQRQPAAPPSQ